MLLISFLCLFPAVYSLTCYNVSLSSIYGEGEIPENLEPMVTADSEFIQGMKMLRMQSVGDTVEECPASAYCYNMTASAAFVVDLVKAGCSTWRCMVGSSTLQKNC